MHTKEGFTKEYGFPISDQATEVLNFAEDEARRSNHSYKGTEHILLGLVRGEEPILKALGVDLQNTRKAVVYIIGEGEKAITGEIGFTPRAINVVKLGIGEARRVGDPELSRLHLLSGLAREGEGIAAGVLESFGLRLSTIEALCDSAIIEHFLTDPQQPDATKVQIGRILRGTVGLISPKRIPLRVSS